jgi:hypothetical protein
MACNIFTVSRLLANEHDRCARGTFSEDSLRGMFPEVTGVAIRGCFTQGSDGVSSVFSRM